MTTSPIISRIHRELTVKGFVRKKSTWNRQIGTRIEVINVQKSKWSDSVVLNAGVMVRDIYFVCWGKEPGLFVEELECIVRARPGDLSSDKRDIWWDIRSESAADEMVACLDSTIHPFLTRMHSLEAMRDWLTLNTERATARFVYPPPFIYLAVILSKLGDMDAACKKIVELEKRTQGPWKEKVQEALVRLGCDCPTTSH